MSAPELRRTLRFKPKEGKVRILSSPKGAKPAKETTNGEYTVSNVSIDGLCFKTPFKTAPGEDMTISLGNHSMEEITGYAQSELLKKLLFTDYVHPDEGARRHPRGEEPWTTPALLEERGRPWRAEDVPPAALPRPKHRPPA